MKVSFHFQFLNLEERFMLLHARPGINDFSNKFLFVMLSQCFMSAMFILVHMIWYDMIYLPVFCPFWPYLFASSCMCSLCYWSMCKLKEKEKEKRKGRGVQFCVYREFHNINITQSFMYAHFYAVIVETFRSHLISMHLLNVPGCIVLWGFDLFQSIRASNMLCVMSLSWLCNLLLTISENWKIYKKGLV